MAHFHAPHNGIVTVGFGRGFLIAGRRDNLIIIAAHCLPHFPPSMSFSATYERTYEGLIGAPGSEPNVWAQCLFVDPIGDIAVLGPPDSQELSDECDAYLGLTENAEEFSLRDIAARDRHKGYLCGLDGKWFECILQHMHGPLWIAIRPEDKIASGMSGSPIVLTSGEAVGVVCCSAGRWGGVLFSGSQR